MTRSIRGALVLVGAMLTGLCCFCSGAAAVSITVTGPEEVVFDYTTMRCDDADLPDGPAQAIRDSTGRIVVSAASGGGRRLTGLTFNSLTRDCTSPYPLTFDPNPAHYRWSNSLYGLYTENGSDIYALVHNEWHGFEIPGACPAGFARRRCGSGGITYAVSNNRGDTFSAPAPPDNLIATVPPRPTIDDVRTGLFSPTNPIKKGDYYYAIVLSGTIGDQDIGACAMRTRDIADPSSWRGWDGTSFSLRFRNNYYENTEPQRTHMCEPVSPNEILSMTRSLTYNTALGKYVLTGSAAKFDPATSRNVFGLYLSTSDDLIHWSMRELMIEVPSLASHQCGGPDAAAYPSLIDHDSTDRNYRLTDSTMYLYYTHFHYDMACQFGLDRDLVRVPIQISP
jgi:hypothetical protein